MPGTAPDITSRIPAVLSALELYAGASAAGGVAAYGMSIGGLPFNLAPAPDRQYVRESAPQQRQQIDTSREPGEQTLAQWWVRDQDSWHRGCGIRYYDPGTDPTTQYRFHDSRGVNVWDRGQLSLLFAMDQPRESADEFWVTGGLGVGGEDCVFVNDGGTVSRISTSTTDYTASDTPVGRVAIAGDVILVAYNDGLLVGDREGSSLSRAVATAGGAITPYWVKQRIIGTKGKTLFEMGLSGGTVATLTTLWQHPASDWTWTAVSETPDAIIAAGYSGDFSAVYAFVLTDDASGTPVLSSAFQVAELPRGEQITSMRSYLGTFLGIGTDKGLRVASIADNGRIAYGPRLVDTDSPIVDLTAFDKFLYALTVDPDGVVSAVRVDLSTQIEDLVFPWAWDARCAAGGTPTSIGFYGGSISLVIGVTGSGLWVQSDTRYEDGGYVVSGRIRYATAEDKQFQFAKVSALVPTDCTVELSTIDRDDTEALAQVLTSTSVTADALLPALSDPAAWASFKVALTSSVDDGAESPTVNSLQVKALPVPPPQRRIVFPLACFDYEADRFGTKVGADGSAWARLRALEALDEANATFGVVDYTTGENFLAKIENIHFERSMPAEKHKANFGGYLMLTLVKLA